MELEGEDLEIAWQGQLYQFTKVVARTGILFLFLVTTEYNRPESNRCIRIVSLCVLFPNR